jgi:hypothetical protein
MLPIRIKACSESDLRMLGNLARNIQRVLPVTQADIDAAAALGKGWVVWKVIEVTDPIDNLRGGTQLVIKQNSITPGQNVRRVLIVQGPGGQMVVVGPDGSPLSLPDAIADTLQYVKAYGGLQRTVLPAGYQQVMYVDVMASSYLTTDIVLTYDCRVEYDFATTTLASGGATTYLGVRPDGSGNGGLRVARISSKVFRIYGFGTYKDSSTLVANNTRYKFIWDNQHATITTVGNTIFDESYTNTGDNTYPVTINGWNSAGTVTPGTEDVFVYSLKIWNNQGQLVANYIPCKKLDPLTVGFYDTVSQSFKAATSGTFAAGPDAVPTPTTPLPIVCNNGELVARHASGLPIGYTLVEGITATGTQYIDTGITLASTDVIETEFKNSTSSDYGAVYGIYATGESSAFYANQTYYGYDASNSKVNTNVAVDNQWHTAIHNFVDGTLQLDNTTVTFTPFTFTNTDNNGLFTRFYNGSYGYFFKGSVKRHKITRNGVVMLDMVSAQRDSDNVLGMYDLVSGTFFTNDGTGSFTAGTTLNDPVGAYAVGPIETIADSTSHTATCEDLLSYDADYTDIQEVISGTVTRKAVAKVLDGTESWTKLGNNNAYYISIPEMKACNPVENGISTHFVGTNAATASMPDYSVKNTYATGDSGQVGAISIKVNSISTVAGFQQYLADLYAAGTPVIVLYPLATEATESVPGQTLQVADGANTLTITQAGMDGLQLEAEYEKAV